MLGGITARLSKKGLEKLREILHAEFLREFDEKESEEAGLRVLRLMKMLRQPLPRERAFPKAA